MNSNSHALKTASAIFTVTLLILAASQNTWSSPQLTVMGAELAGNAAQTIPAWTGGITTKPAGYKVGDRHIDPFANDESLFDIEFGNSAEFADKLSSGHLALMEKHPNSYRLNIYPTRRSGSHPQHILDHTVKYSPQARLVDNGAGLAGIVQGIPFPQPKNGEQAIWNSLVSYKGSGVKRYVNSAEVSGNGKFTLNVVKQEAQFPYHTDSTTLENFDNVLVRGISYIEAPSNAAGVMILYHVNLNSEEDERNAWLYNPKKRRVSRAPSVHGGTPAAASDGVHLVDQNGMFSGKITNFEWRLLGKKELYVPYNAYQLHGSTITSGDIVVPGHVNQKLCRYELHRVWQVEATRKEGVKHPHKRRVFYLDEDSWRILLAEHYDDDDQLDRFSESHTINYYEIPLLSTTLDVFYKLNADQYFLQGLDNQHPVNDFSFAEEAKYFQPGALKRKAKK